MRTDYSYLYEGFVRVLHHNISTPRRPDVQETIYYGLNRERRILEQSVLPHKKPRAWEQQEKKGGGLGTRHMEVSGGRKHGGKSSNKA